MVTMIEITGTEEAKKAAQWLTDARGTMLAAEQLPRLFLPVERLLRAQTLAMRLSALDSMARFFGGPEVKGHLEGYVIDWQADDDLCRTGSGVADFCMHLSAARARVAAALDRWSEHNDYGTHRCREEITGGAS